MSWYVFVDFFLKKKENLNISQVTSFNIVASEYASHTGDGKDESGSKKKPKKGPDPEDEAEADSDSSSNFGKALKEAREIRAKKAAPKKKAKKLDALFGVKWWRIVLGMLSRLEHGGCH